MNNLQMTGLTNLDIAAERLQGVPWRKHGKLRVYLHSMQTEPHTVWIEYTKEIPEQEFDKRLGWFSHGSVAVNYNADAYEYELYAIAAAKQFKFKLLHKISAMLPRPLTLKRMPKTWEEIDLKK